MNKPKNIFNLAALFFICLLSLTNSFAQTETPQRQSEPSYEVILNVLTASDNTTDKMPIPQALSGVVRKLQNTYSFSNYRQDATFLGRIGNTGNFEYKSVSSQNQENFMPTFSEWNLTGLRNLPGVQGKNSIEFQGFRFGQRIPIKTGNGVNYESIGLAMQRFSLPEGVPTVVGSLTTANANTLMFLVLTVRNAE